mmetsp:Transcript_29341/g.39056  ORF Transcript_29341/g.39056 Transcript_29341/m.39056 type:complete len:100 (+) Transcript_29341:1607-1906(+)
MLKRLSKLKSLASDNKIEALYGYVRDVFLHDEWILKEYSGGFNTQTLADVDSIEEIIAIGETSLEVSAQISAHLLAKVREQGGREACFGYESNALNDEQ